MTGGLEQRISLLTTHQHVTSVKNFFLFFLKILLLICVESALTVLLLTLGAHAQRGFTVVGSVCVYVSVCPLSTNDTTYLTGNEGKKICGIFSETAAFVSYGVKQKLKSRYANERWAYLDQIPAPFRAGGVRSNM